MRFDKDTPIFSGMILELARARDVAWEQVDALARQLADIEALHEPDANGDCPTCGTAAPCLTHLLIRRQITVEQAFAAIRDHRPIDLAAAETRDTPAVPSLAQMLATPAPGLDRFFDALLRNPVDETAA